MYIVSVCVCVKPFSQSMILCLACTKRCLRCGDTKINKNKIQSLCSVSSQTPLEGRNRNKCSRCIFW